ncbi:hypothetical protein ACJJTC_005911 [Scirpophaga incertulas]
MGNSDVICIDPDCSQAESQLPNTKWRGVTASCSVHKRDRSCHVVCDRIVLGAKRYDQERNSSWLLPANERRGSMRQGHWKRVRRSAEGSTHHERSIRATIATPVWQLTDHSSRVGIGLYSNFTRRDAPPISGINKNASCCE